jgi:hypothetical protein
MHGMQTAVVISDVNALLENQKTKKRVFEKRAGLWIATHSTSTDLTTSTLYYLIPLL